MIFVLAVADLQALGRFGKQVDHRRAVQRQMAAVHHAFQRAVSLIQQDDNVEFLRVIAAAQKRCQLAQADELETRRKGKILLQQPVAVEVTQIVRQQRLLRRKAFLL